MGQNDRFTILMGLAGCSEVVHHGETVPLDFGQTLLIKPASLGPCQISPRGDATVLTCVVPSKADNCGTADHPGAKSHGRILWSMKDSSGGGPPLTRFDPARRDLSVQSDWHLISENWSSR